MSITYPVESGPKRAIPRERRRPQAIPTPRVQSLKHGNGACARRQQAANSRRLSLGLTAMVFVGAISLYAAHSQPTQVQELAAPVQVVHLSQELVESTVPTFQTATQNAPSIPSRRQQPSMAVRAIPLLPVHLSSYDVRAGDSLFSVADRFGLEVQTLVWANDRLDPAAPPEGSELVIPSIDGVLHHVRAGDTLVDLAAHYHSDLEVTVVVNGLRGPTEIREGQRIIFPGGHVPLQVAASTAAASPGSEAGSRRPTVPPFPTSATPEQASFILSIVEPARIAQAETGVPASFTIAEAITGSFWGMSRLARDQQNYFGVREAETTAPPQHGLNGVSESTDGLTTTRRESFRTYASATEAFTDNGRRLRDDPRFASAFTATFEPDRFANDVSRLQFASEPGHGAMLVALMRRFNLYAYDLEGE